MTTLSAPATDGTDNGALRITPIAASANPHSPGAGRPADITPADKPPAKSLAALDKRFGPLLIGELTITRTELQVMGARVNGNPVTPQNVNFKRPEQAFLDALSFAPGRVEARIKAAPAADHSTVALFFFELACARSPGAPPLFDPVTAAPPDDTMQRFGKLLGTLQEIDIHRVESLEHLPTWVDKTKTRLQSGAGVGLQLYGLYSGILGIADAIKNRDAGEVLFNAGSIASELGSIGVEVLMAKAGESMLKHGGTVFAGFSATSAGKVLTRGGGLFASVLTLPFDITSAIKSFEAASRTTGKQAQDHYFSGALSVASASISTALGLASLAGFASTAGPVGIVAAVVMVLGAEIYRAARVVDDIDDYIELSAHERLRSGWFAFTRQELDQDVLDRFSIAKALQTHERQLENSARHLLEGAYKKHIEQVVNGSFRVELEPTKVWHHAWSEQAGEKPFKLVKEPVIVDSDDVIDARDGLPANLGGLVTGEPGADKGIFWQLGDGQDKVTGLAHKANFFSYRSGTKTLTGGEKNDEFYFQTTVSDLNRPQSPAPLSVLQGGDGIDLLAFEGRRPLQDTRHAGYTVDLQNGSIALLGTAPQTEPVQVARIESIENISTLHLGQSRVIGDDQPNRITANGNDLIEAGAGDDSIVVRGPYSKACGGTGHDRYYLADTTVETTIVEDPGHPSEIEFGWPLQKIQRWEISGTALRVTSLRGDDGELPEHVLTIEDVYKEVAGQRQLNNGQWLFRTQDGYQLMPSLPAQLPDLTSQEVDVIVLTSGEAPPAPFTINGATTVLSGPSVQHFFVSRNSHKVFFIAYKGTAKTSSVVYLDYRSSEIHAVRASYEVQAHSSAAAYTKLTYGHFNLWIVLPHKTVNFTGITQEKPGSGRYTGTRYLTPGIHNAHDVVLVFQDGKSWRLAPPRVSYAEDAAQPGDKSLAAMHCLQPRKGTYLFSRPQVAQTRLLPALPHRIDINASRHQGIYVLQGQSSNYDVYPASNSIIRLSTPGALAGTADASRWTIHTVQMQEFITVHDIRLNGQHLHIGTVLIELPSVNDDLPVESVSVVTSAGNTYEVSLLFAVLQMSAIDARAYVSIDALLKDIEAHRLRHELAVRVVVDNVGLTGARTGTVYYDSTRDAWGVDGDLTRRIDPAQLVILAPAPGKA
ncbi:calcium-binding protein [Pseudomonas sp.]|jgi:hypothetical protein|uniref:calcium-binding protein n=1 Tax=Pseudomonas sp. TaxID=306 RepID=UPI002E340E08|nr:calcium-binding protein [Pseudomonas sp.]HEX4547244.1 calcium-binding protein [Pseudomonas sp.]